MEDRRQNPGPDPRPTRADVLWVVLFNVVLIGGLWLVGGAPT